MEMEEFVHNYANALFLEEREVNNLSKAISNVFASNDGES